MKHTNLYIRDVLGWVLVEGQMNEELVAEDTRRMCEGYKNAVHLWSCW